MMMIYRMKKQMCWTWSGERKERKELMNERINDILIAPTVQDLIHLANSLFSEMTASTTINDEGNPRNQNAHGSRGAASFIQREVSLLSRSEPQSRS